MNHYPLVCEPALLAGAEARINAFPRIHYDWAIKYADVPLKPFGKQARKPRADKAERLEKLDHRNRSMAEHPDYGGAFDGFTVTSDADGGL